jgi:hypothetical protein
MDKISIGIESETKCFRSCLNKIFLCNMFADCCQQHSWNAMSETRLMFNKDTQYEYNMKYIILSFLCSWRMFQVSKAINCVEKALVRSIER